MGLKNGPSRPPRINQVLAGYSIFVGFGMALGMPFNAMVNAVGHYLQTGDAPMVIMFALFITGEILLVPCAILKASADRKE